MLRFLASRGAALSTARPRHRPANHRHPSPCRLPPPTLVRTAPAPPPIPDTLLPPPQPTTSTHPVPPSCAPLQVLGRLAIRNPAHLTPQLRRLLLSFLTQLRHAPIPRGKQTAAAMLSQLGAACPRLLYGCAHPPPGGRGHPPPPPVLAMSSWDVPTAGLGRWCAAGSEATRIQAPSVPTFPPPARCSAHTHSPAHPCGRLSARRPLPPEALSASNALTSLWRKSVAELLPPPVQLRHPNHRGAHPAHVVPRRRRGGHRAEGHRRDG